jgi:hypothetical protein
MAFSIHSCSAALFLVQLLILEQSYVSFVSGFQPSCLLKSSQHAREEHFSQKNLNQMFPGRHNSRKTGTFVVLAIHSKHPNGGEEDRFMLSKSPFLGRFLPENDVVTYEV